MTANDQVPLFRRVTEDDETFKEGGSDYKWIVASTVTAAASVGNINDSADFEIDPVGAMGATGSVTDGGIHKRVYLDTQSGGLADQGDSWHLNAVNDTGHVAMLAGARRYIGTTNAITGVRLITSSGNLTSGTVVLRRKRTA